MRASRVLLAAWVASLVLGLAALRGAPEEGNPERKAPTQKIAFLDLSRVLKSHRGLKAATAQLEKDVAEAEAAVRKERKDTEAMIKRLQTHATESREYKDLERQIAERTAPIDIFPPHNRFAKQEADAYYDAFQEVEAEVQAYAKENQIAAVFRFHPTPADPADPTSIVGVINRPVIYWEDGMDITPAILERVNRKAE